MRRSVARPLAIILKAGGASASLGFIIPFIIQRAAALLVISAAVIGTAAADADDFAAIHIASLADVTPCFIFGAVAALTAITLYVAGGDIVRGVIIAGT